MKYCSKRKLSYLKVKAKSLAAEAKIIRKEERKAHGYYRANYSTKDHESWWEWSSDQREAFDDWNGLRDHRVKDVRREARATHIARGFLTGKRYHTVEPSVTDEYHQGLALDRAAAIIRKYSNGDLEAKVKRSYKEPPMPDFSDREAMAEWRKKCEQIKRDAWRAYIHRWANPEPLTMQQRLKLSIISKSA